MWKRRKERVFKRINWGLFNDNPVTERQLEWADLIVVMEERHREEISKRFPSVYLSKRIIVLDIPDIYNYNEVKLVEILKRVLYERLDRCMV